MAIHAFARAADSRGGGSAMTRIGVRATTALRALASLAATRGRLDDPARPVRRILVAHYLLLGDTILLAPLLKALAARYPDAERVVLARPAVAPLFDGRPYGATAMPFDRRDPQSRRDVIGSGPWDLAIVPDDNRYAWLARAAGARHVIGFARDRPGWKNLMLDQAVPYPATPAAWADIAARCLAGDEPSSDPPAFTAGEWPAPAFAPFERPTDAYAVLHVGASTPLKQWPADRWQAVAERLRADGLRIVWSGGASERAVLDAIASGARDHDIDLLGRLDLPQLWSLLATARLLVCPDTGIAHLGRVVGVPTVALFGPGSRVVHGAGAFWADAPFHAVTADDFPCRDQRTLYRREVPWVRRCGRRFDAAALPSGRSDPSACGEALCMQAVDAATVVSVVGRTRR